MASVMKNEAEKWPLLWTSGRKYVDRLKKLLRLVDSTTALLIRSSKRWGLAAAIAIGLDNPDDVDEDTTTSGTSSVVNASGSRKARLLWRHWHHSVADMRDVARVIALISSRCEACNDCPLCADYNSSSASAVDAIPCLLVVALQIYHKLTLDVADFLASTRHYNRPQYQPCVGPNYDEMDLAADTVLEQPPPVLIMSSSRRFPQPTTTLFAAVTQPYRFGGRVGLFGHYLRSLKIILLLTCIKHDCVKKPVLKIAQSDESSSDEVLKKICSLASDLEAVEKVYVKTGKRLLFCGHDIIQMWPTCKSLSDHFESIKSDFPVSYCWYSCFMDNMSCLTQMLQRFESKQKHILLQMKISANQTKGLQAKQCSMEKKFHCEDIEPVSLNWNKVDEALLLSGQNTSEKIKTNQFSRDFDEDYDDDFDSDADEDHLNTMVRSTKNMMLMSS